MVKGDPHFTKQFELLELKGQMAKHPMPCGEQCGTRTTSAYIQTVRRAHSKSSPYIHYFCLYRRRRTLLPEDVVPTGRFGPCVLYDRLYSVKFRDKKLTNKNNNR